MASWAEMSEEARSSAQALFAARQWRSCVSRAYYAAYALLSGHVAAAGVTFPRGWEGPSHSSLRHLVAAHVRGLTTRQRQAVGTLSLQLYEWRCEADYKPSADIDEHLARNAQRSFEVIAQILSRATE